MSQPDEGIPDGLTVDAARFVWSVRWLGGCLVRYDAEGKTDRRVLIPASQTSSMAFGGNEFSDIFVTSAGQPDSLPLAPLGYDARKVCNGGKLFRLNLGISGKEEYKARVSLPKHTA